MKDIKLNPKEIEERAKASLKKDMMKEAIEEKKKELRRKNSFWDKIFPYTINIRRK